MGGSSRRRSRSAWSGRIVIAKPVDTTRRRHSAAGLLRCEPGLLTLIGYTHSAVPSRRRSGTRTPFFREIRGNHD